MHNLYAESLFVNIRLKESIIKNIYYKKGNIYIYIYIYI